MALLHLFAPLVIDVNEIAMIVHAKSTTQNKFLQEESILSYVRRAKENRMYIDQTEGENDLNCIIVMKDGTVIGTSIYCDTILKRIPSDFKVKASAARRPKTPKPPAERNPLPPVKA